MIDIYSLYLKRFKEDKYKITWPPKMKIIDKISFIETLIMYIGNDNDYIDSLKYLNLHLEKYRNQGLKKN